MKKGWPLLLLSISLLLLFFQNCSPTPYQFFLTEEGSLKTEFSAADNVDGGGNGGGYGGKLRGDYVHYLPGFSCDGTASPKGRLLLYDQNAVLTDNNSDQCGANTEILSLSMIEESSLQNSVVGFKDKIFENSNTFQNQIPDRLVEVWCREQGAENAFEILSTFDHVQNAASAKILTLQGDQSVSSSSESVFRVLSSKRVEYSNDYFDLVVDKDRPSPKVGQFLGEARFFSGSNPRATLNKVMDCRLGGGLDARIWPAQLIWEATTVDFLYNKISDEVYAQSKEGEVFNQILNQTESALTLFRPTIKMKDSNFGSMGLVPRPDRSGFIFWGPGANIDSRSPDQAPVLRLYTSDKDRLTELSNKYFRIGQSGNIHSVKIDPDLNLVFYQDAEHDRSGSKSLYWIRASTLDGATIGQQINHDLPLSSNEGTFEYLLVRKKQLAIYIGGKVTSARLYSTHYSLLTSSVSGIEVLPPIELSSNLPQEWEIPGTTSLIHKEGGDWVGYEVRSKMTNPLFCKRGIGFSNILTKETKVFACFSFASLIETFGTDLFRLQNDLNGTIQFLDPASLKIQIPKGPLIDCLWPAEISWSLSPSLLAGATYKDGKVIVFSIDQSTGECRKRNEVAIQMQTPSTSWTWSASPNKESIFIMGAITPEAQNNLLWIPMNGRPSLLINSLTLGRFGVKKAQFTEDSGGILYLGDDLGLSQLFRFPLPY